VMESGIAMTNPAAAIATREIFRMLDSIFFYIF
jgi:hypothetical protein